MYRIGIDLGGTKIEGVLLDRESHVIARRRISTEQKRGYPAILDRIAGLAAELEKEARQDCTVGICTPGSLSPRTGQMRNSNTVCLNGKALKEDLENALGRRIAMENDANCFAKAEAHLGSGRGYGCVFGVILGTGVGGGIVMDGELHKGALHIAGEWGHHTLYPDGNACYCGRSGCVETYLSGPALEKRWQALTRQTDPLPDIVRRLETGERTETALQWKAELLNNFGMALGNVINILDPDVIVLGGGVSNMSLLYREGLEEVRRNIFGDVTDTPIVQHQLGDSAGVLGAAWLS